MNNVFMDAPHNPRAPPLSASKGRRNRVTDDSGVLDLGDTLAVTPQHNQSTTNEAADLLQDVLQPTLQEFNDTFKFKGLLGKGGFAEVFKVSYLDNAYAFKVMMDGVDPQGRAMFFKEAKVLGACKHHTGIVSFHGLVKVPTQSNALKNEKVRWGILMELCAAGSAAKLVMDCMRSMFPSSVYTKRQALEWCTQIADALNFMHQMQPPVAHRDVKSENILLTQEGGRLVAKLSDLGLHVMMDFRKGPPTMLLRNNSRKSSRPCTSSSQLGTAGTVGRPASAILRVSRPQSPLLSTAVSLQMIMDVEHLPTTQEGHSECQVDSRPIIKPSRAVPCSTAVHNPAVHDSAVHGPSKYKVDSRPSTAMPFGVGLPEPTKPRHNSAAPYSSASPVPTHQRLTPTPETTHTQWDGSGLGGVAVDDGDGRSDATKSSVSTHMPYTNIMSRRMAELEAAIAFSLAEGHLRLSTGNTNRSGVDSHPENDSMPAWEPVNVITNTVDAISTVRVNTVDAISTVRVNTVVAPPQVEAPDPRPFGQAPRRCTSMGTGFVPSTPHEVNSIQLVLPDLLYCLPDECGKLFQRHGSMDSGKGSSGSACAHIQGAAPHLASSMLRRVLEGEGELTGILEEDEEFEFGFNLTGNTGSAFYMAPEVYLKQPYSTKVDVFSFGMVMYELFSSILLCMFYSADADNPVTVLETYPRTVSGGWRPPRPNKLENRIWFLITACWDQDALARPNMASVLAELREIAGEMDAFPEDDSSGNACCTIN